MFQYNVTTYASHEELTYRTNDPRRAIADFLDGARRRAHMNIVNGHTGEVLVIANHPEGEKHCTDEMALMILGYLMEESWGSVEAEVEEEPIDVPAIIAERFGVPVEAVIALH